MNQCKEPVSGAGGAGGAEGASVGSAEPTGDGPTDEPREEIEIPIGMPVPEKEVERLKTAARRHRDGDEHEPPAQSDSN